MNPLYSKFEYLFPYRCCQKYRIDSEFTIVTNYSNKMLYLNETAGNIFLLCNGKRTVQEICSQLMSEYEISQDVIQDDLIKIIRDLQLNKVIKLSQTIK